MLTDLRAGKAQVLIVWKRDRLVRRMGEFGKVWAALEEGDVALASVQESFDTSTTAGQMLVNMLVGVAQMESENISVRQRSKHAELRRKGRWSGGRRAFGLNDDWSKIIDY